MNYQPESFNSEATRLLVEEMLDNSAYYTDLEASYQESGPYDGSGLRDVVDLLGSGFYDRQVDLSKVDWEQAAEVVNRNMDIAYGPRGVR